MAFIVTGVAGPAFAGAVSVTVRVQRGATDLAHTGLTATRLVVAMLLLVGVGVVLRVLGSWTERRELR